MPKLRVRSIGSKPKWFLVLQLTLILLFVFMTALVIMSEGKINSSTYDVLLMLGLVGILVTIISLITILFAKRSRVLIRQMILFLVLHLVIMIFSSLHSTSDEVKSAATSAADLADEGKIPSLEIYKSSAIEPEPRDFARTADGKYLNQRVYLTGTVAKIGKEESEIQINLREVEQLDDMKEPIAVRIYRKDTAGKLLKGDEIELWGVVLGSRPALGQTEEGTTIPAVRSHYITLLEK
jgi:hypothetical protein